MKKIRSFISFFLLLVLSVTILPKEALHAFHDHEETRHDIKPVKGTDVGTAHVHCELLQIESPVFTDDSAPLVFVSAELGFHFYVAAPAGVAYNSTSLPSPRGPPAC